MTIDLQCKFYKERRSAYTLTAQREGAGKVDTEQLYKDIKARTNGEIYIGVVGPVRTGKSTFIKRFMDVMVLPRMEDEHKKERTRDELPQSAAGKTIMTTEPKFVPKDAAVIRLDQDVEVRIRLIDCVGYMVKGRRKIFGKKIDKLPDAAAAEGSADDIYALSVEICWQLIHKSLYRFYVILHRFASV